MVTRYTMFRVVLIHLVVFASGWPADDPTKQKVGEVCGYESCPSLDSEVLNVHLVAHTHDDVGWLKTVDQYYYGSSNDIQKAGVQYIIDSVISELWEDPTRRFIYVETSFLYKWWGRQSEKMKKRVHQLVRQGRLEFIGGAWSMNDEASTHYQSIIDQFTLGLRVLNDTFGECGRPKVAWQIDPFGHSKEFSSMLAQMSYDGLFLGRIDYQDKEERMENKTMEMVWRGDDNVGSPSDLFTGVLYNDYAAPKGFCFDILCNDEPIIDDKHSPLNNVETKVDEFLKIMNKMSEAYQHKHVLVTMGEDFHYQEAGMWFRNMDKLIYYANERAEKEGLKVKLFYSTPSCYLKAVKDANLTLPTKQDDFFPYASDKHAYWTGYFTSRPTTKYFERHANGYLQAVKQLQVLGNLEHNNKQVLHKLKDAMGVMQHHDAITGTEKEHVTHDYERILTEAVDDALTVARQAFTKLIYESPPTIFPNFIRCEFNQSQCVISENKENFILTIYNPLGWKVTAPIRVPIVDGQYSVTNPEGKEETIQIAKLSPEVLDIPTRTSIGTHELVFLAGYIPALGFRQYYVKRLNDIKTEDNSNTTVSQTVLLSNQRYTLKVDIDNGLSEISLPDGSAFQISCDFHMYKGFDGENQIPEDRSSGAYIFRPNGSISDALNKTIGKVTQGPIFDQIEYHYDIGSLSFTLYEHEDIDDVEVTWTVGIDVSDNVGKEIVLKYKTAINNNGEFFTDASGRQMVKRILNERPQWIVTLAEPIAGNYYPVVNKIHINDEVMKFSVITDRSQGGTSLNNGNIELMVHRRLLSDDGKGVGEALNEQIHGRGLVARGNHYLYLLPITKEYSIREKKRTIEHHLNPQVYVSDATDIDIKDWLKLKNEWSGLANALPEGIHLLTLEPWTSDSLLLRLENYLDVKDYEYVIKVDLANLFEGLELVDINETNLAANLWIENHMQWTWRTENEFSNNFNDQYGKSTTNENERDAPRRARAITDFNVGLGPKEFRTFIVKYQYKK